MLKVFTFQIKNGTRHLPTQNGYFSPPSSPFSPRAPLARLAQHSFPLSALGAPGFQPSELPAFSPQQRKKSLLRSEPPKKSLIRGRGISATQKSGLTQPMPVFRYLTLQALTAYLRWCLSCGEFPAECRVEKNERECRAHD